MAMVMVYMWDMNGNNGYIRDIMVIWWWYNDDRMAIELWSYDYTMAIQWDMNGGMMKSNGFFVSQFVNTEEQ